LLHEGAAAGRGLSGNRNLLGRTTDPERIEVEKAPSHGEWLSERK